MKRIKKQTQGVDHLDDTAFRWLNTDHGESAVKNDIEEKWNQYLESVEIYNELSGHPKSRNSRHQRLKTWIAAASIVLLVAGGLWYYSSRLEEPAPQPPISHISKDIRLTLPDGEEILLDSHTENGIVAKHGGISLVCENGTLIHKKQSEDTFAESEHEIQWSSLEVPRGNLFDLVLEDGTKVWLNADSRIRFPVAFGEGERRVFVEGEAYFIVAHDVTKPFIVETPRQDITVTGTEFNIYAYPDEPDERTSLIEGGVMLRSGNNESVNLAPGQQAVLQTDLNKYIILETDARDVAVWRDGLFVLDGNTFGEVFLKLSRWYDFAYSFDGEEIARLTFSGNLCRYEDVEIIFDILKTIAPVKIVVKDNQVRISKK